MLERSARRVPTRRSAAPLPTNLSRQGAVCLRRVEYPWITFRSECEGMRRDQSSPGHIQKKYENESLPLCPLLGGGAAKGGKTPWIGWGGGRAVPWNSGERTWGNPVWGTWPARERTLRTVTFRDGISRWEFEGEPGTEPWDTEPRDTRDTRLNASQDGFRGETVRENPEGRKGGRVSRVRGPHCATSPAVFRKGHRRGVPSRLAFGRYWRIGHLPALPHPQPCLAFGRDWRGGVAIELRPILQPTSLRVIGRVGPLAGTSSEL